MKDSEARLLLVLLCVLQAQHSWVEMDILLSAGNLGKGTEKRALLFPSTGLSPRERRDGTATAQAAVSPQAE